MSAGISVSQGRIISLDQFRGYTVAGMFLVNFLGSYAFIQQYAPLLSHHHTYFSYADSIMPQFFFAVGFAYRLTFLRRRDSDGAPAAYYHVVQRCLALLLLALVVHRLDGRYDSWAKLQELGLTGFLRTAFQRNYFQTLTHIALASLFLLPVIAARPLVRLGYAVIAAVVFHMISAGGYYEWVMKRPGIDGGPLAFLSWTIPLVVGTLAFDLVVDQQDHSVRVRPLIMAAIFLMLLGYLLSCLNLITQLKEPISPANWRAYLVEPPFVPPSHPINIWTMSQRAGSVSYLTFGAGFSMAVYGFFVLLCDHRQFQLAVFRTLGTNALLAYILHDLVNDAVKPFFPKDSPAWYGLAGFFLSFGICYLCLYYLERQRLFLKL